MSVKESKDDERIEMIIDHLNRITPLPWCAGWGGDPEVQGMDDAGPYMIISGNNGGICESKPNPYGHARTWDQVIVNIDFMANAPEYIKYLLDKLDVEYNARE